MLRFVLLTLTLACIPALAQNGPETREQIVSRQNLKLARELIDDLARYTSASPKIPQSRAFASVLEEQSALLQQPAELRPADKVQKQIEAITLQLKNLRNVVANHLPTHPEMSRDHAIIDLLEENLRILQRR